MIRSAPEEDVESERGFEFGVAQLQTRVDLLEHPVPIQILALRMRNHSQSIARSERIEPTATSKYSSRRITEGERKHDPEAESIETAIRTM